MIGWAEVGNAAAADQNPGGAGLSTAQRTVGAAVAADDPQVFQVGSDAVNNHPSTSAAGYIALAVLFIVLKFAAEESGNASDFGNIKIGIWNIVTITIAAVLGLTFAKYAFARIQVPGLSNLVAAA